MEPSLWAFATLAVELRLTPQEIYFLLLTIAQQVRASQVSVD